MSIFDTLYRSFAQPLLNWSHADAESVQIISADGTIAEAVDAIQLDEQWETDVDITRGERRVRVCRWSVNATDLTTPQLRGKLKLVATGEIWNIRSVVGRDANWVQLECVRPSAHEVARAGIRSE